MKKSELKEIIKEEISKALNEEGINNDVKKEAISRLSQFFRVPSQPLYKFNFDGNDDMRELSKVLNSTNDQGTAIYYKMAIKLAKEEIGNL